MADEPATRGSWTLDEAVALIWDTAGLDTIFRNEWPVASKLSTKYQPLNDGFARPVPPGPYCVFEKMIPFVRNHMTGVGGGRRENQFQQILIQFSIHAKSTATESGKSICVRLADRVAEAYDPDTVPWEMEDDSLVSVKRGPDFHTREGNDEWVWVLQYDVMIDAEYQQA